MATERSGCEEVPLVARCLTRLVMVAAHYPRLVLLLTILLIALSLVLACTRLTFLTQRNDLVSPNKDYQQRWRQYVAEFGDDDDMVVVVRGKNREQMTAALEELAGKLHKQPQYFDRIFYKVDLHSLRNRALLYLPADKIRQIQDNLKSMNLLLEPPIISGFDPLFSWKSLTLSQLLGEADRRLYNASMCGGLRPEDEPFFLQLAAITESATAMLDSPAGYRNPWRSILPEQKEQQGQKDMMAEPQYFFSGDNTLAFLLVRPSKNMSSFTSAQDSIEEMRRLIDDMRKQHPGLQFGLTGLPVLENDEINASQSDTTTASWLALIGVALLYLLVYRCLRYPLLTLSTLMIGMILTLGWLTITVGHLNILSATFAVMLIGLGDYGVLWITRYEQDRAAGLDIMSALINTTRHVGPSILTAALTTALAFYAAMLVDFRAVAELGWIAGSGVLFCALACFTFLPALVRLCDRKDVASKSPLLTLRTTISLSTLLCRRGRIDGTPLPGADKKTTIPLPSAWLPWLQRRPRWVLVCCAVLVIIFGFFVTQVRYDHNLLHLQARGLESVKWELTLIHHTAGASWHALSSTTTPEEALALKARYEKLPCVSRVVEVATLVPAEQELKIELLKDIYHRLRHLPKRGVEIPHAVPNIGHLDDQITTLMIELEPRAEKNKGGAITRLNRSLRKLQAQLQKKDREPTAERLQKFEQILTRDLAEDLHQLRDVSKPAYITTADLPSSLRERYVGKSGKWLLRVFGKGSLWEFGPLENFVEQIREVDPDVTGKPISTLEGLRSMQNGFKWACIYAFIAMIVVLLLDFRNLWHTLLAMAPLAVGMIFTMGLLGLFNIPLNPANMIALPLILGVGADNGVHVIHDFLSRSGAGRYTLSESTGRGILVAALTTILGFGTLMISHHRGLSGLGLLLTIGVSSCLAAALIFLPCLLRLVTSTKEKSVDSRTLRIPSKAA